MLRLIDNGNDRRTMGVPMQNNAFGLYIKNMRLRRGLTQTDVQKVLELSSSGVISHWEQEKSYMSNENARKLAKLYQVDPDELLFRLFTAKSLEPTLRKWCRQYKGCSRVLAYIQECIMRENIRHVIETSG